MELTEDKAESECSFENSVRGHYERLSLRTDSMKADPSRDLRPTSQVSKPTISRDLLNGFVCSHNLALPRQQGRTSKSWIFSSMHGASQTTGILAEKSGASSG